MKLEGLRRAVGNLADVAARNSVEGSTDSHMARIMENVIGELIDDIEQNGWPVATGDSVHEHGTREQEGA